MSGLAMPTFIFMISNFPVHRQMRLFLICSSRTVACLVRTGLPQQLWRPCKIMSLIITKYVAYISLWLTCSGLEVQRHPMIRPFCKAYGSPARESLESIHHWPWLRPSLLRRTMPQGCGVRSLLAQAVLVQTLVGR